MQRLQAAVAAWVAAALPQARATTRALVVLVQALGLLLVAAAFRLALPQLALARSPRTACVALRAQVACALAAQQQLQWATAVRLPAAAVAAAASLRPALH